MKKKYDVVNVLDTCVDFIVLGKDVVPEFAQTEKLIDDYSVELGGSGGIFSSQTAKLGLHTVGIGTVGEDTFGKIVQKELEKNGVDLRFLFADEEKKTGVGVLLCRENDRAILTYNGTILEIDPKQITDDILRQTRHLHISSYYLMRQLKPFWKEIAKRAHDMGATVSLDTNWDPEENWSEGLMEVLKEVDVFLPNEQEARFISKALGIKEVEGLSEIVPLLVVKCGEKGAVAFQKGKVWKEDAKKIKVVDTIGAGDSFDGGFLWAWLRGYDIQKCLQAGCYCGARSTEGTGGTRAQAKEEEVIEYLSQRGGEASSDAKEC